MLTKAEIDFIRDNIETDIVKLILQQNRFPNFDVKKLANQIRARKKAIHKLPTFAANEKVYFPSTIAWQQCSSEFTAKYKAKLVKGKKAIDLTGGFGIDTFYLSNYFETFTYVEQQKELCNIVTYNNKVFGKKNIDIIPSLGSYDVIYLDPARRDKHDKKIVTLEDSFPNIIELQETLLNKCKTIMLKTSPMLDIHQALKQLKKVKSVHIVAVENECKELLFLLSNETPIAPIELITANIHKNGIIDIFNSTYNAHQSINYNTPKQYIYDPNKAIHKANIFNEVGTHYKLEKLAPNTHLYTSENFIENFQGRIFELKGILKPSKKVLRKVLKDEKANLVVRNFPDSVKNLKTKLKIKDGGNQFLFAVTLANTEKVLLHCERV